MNEDKAAFWFGYAMDDCDILRANTSARAHLYAAMQVIEKALKGYLVLNDIKFKPVHNLGLLAAKCHEHSDEFPAGLVVRVAELPSYNEIFRYPDEGEVFYPEASEVKQAIEVMNEVMDCVRSLVPELIWDNAESLVKNNRSKYLSDIKCAVCKETPCVCNRDGGGKRVVHRI